MDKDISIVIPVKDRGHLIGRCLDSVSVQTITPAQVIVVDNGSSDNTFETVRKWGADHPCLNLTLLSECSPGASAARNRGLREVTSEYVYFFDSDDEMHPTLLEKAIKAIGDADLIYWKGEVVGLDGKIYPKSFHTDSLLRRHMYNALLSTQLFMCRTSLVREVGGWEEKAAVWNDWELGIRLAMSEAKKVSLAETLVRIHAQEKSITGSAFSHKIGKWENTLDIVEKDIRNSRLSIRDKKRLLDMLTYRRVILAAHYAREGDKTAGRALLDRTLRHSRLNASERILLKLIYKYTSAGGRGAYYLWK